MLRTSLLILLGAILLAACAPSPQGRPGVEAPAEPQAPALSHAELRQELARLPGAEVSEGEPLRVSYPAGVLFGEFALLPMPGGSGMVDALARVLRNSGLSWQLKLRAATGEGEEYDRQLAAERARVLLTYLKGAGVDPRKISLVSLAEAGSPLELTLKTRR